jgi:hypothetical protein
MIDYFVGIKTNVLQICLWKKRFFWLKEFMGFVYFRRREEFSNNGGGKVENKELEKDFHIS